MHKEQSQAGGYMPPGASSRHLLLIKEEPDPCLGPGMECRAWAAQGHLPLEVKGSNWKALGMVLAHSSPCDPHWRSRKGLMCFKCDRRPTESREPSQWPQLCLGLPDALFLEGSPFYQGRFLVSAIPLVLCCLLASTGGEGTWWVTSTCPL